MNRHDLAVMLAHVIRAREKLADAYGHVLNEMAQDRAIAAFLDIDDADASLRRVADILAMYVSDEGDV